MQIASSTDKISSTSNRLVDLNEYMLINSVPYLKENNSPIPFNVVNIDSTQNFCQGKTMNPYQNNFVGKTLNYQNCFANISHQKTNSNNVIVDNMDSNVIYVVTTVDLKSNSTYKSPATSYGILYKLYINDDKTISIKDRVTITSYYDNNVLYLTQDNDSLYVITSEGYWSHQDLSNYGGSTSHTMYKSNKHYIYKINKETLTKSFCDLQKAIYHGSGYFYYGSSSTKYIHHNVYDSTPVVMYEVPNEGLVLYMKSYCSWTGDANSVSGERQRYTVSTYYYSFSTNSLTKITPGNVVPITSNGYNLEPSYTSGSSSISTNYGDCYDSAINCIMSYPNSYLETNNELYQYIVEPTSLGSGYTMKMYYMNQNKEDLLNITYTEIETVFPEDNEYGITELPHPSLSKKGYTSSYSTSLETSYFNLFGYLYETFTQNVNGIDYLHVCYKGDYANPISSRGIYTFKINEDRTAATLISFYEALGGSFRDFMFLKEDRTRILVATATSYHILNFDPISESWISSYDSLQSVRSFLHTKEDKLYAILDDHRIICQDLNGAVMVDFEFEKPIYNYNNADITSYITIWAKNADEEYTATNIKLTLTGNVVWQANGLQTLETTTSAEGPINIPFIIKGHTSINVGVDAII